MSLRSNLSGGVDLRCDNPLCLTSVHFPTFASALKFVQGNPFKIDSKGNVSGWSVRREDGKFKNFCIGCSLRALPVAGGVFV